MKSKKRFTMHIPFECTLIECGSKDCGMRFILHAVLIPDEKHRNECEDAVMTQSDSYFCPYCGTKMKGKKRS